MKKHVSVGEENGPLSYRFYRELLDRANYYDENDFPFGIDDDLFHILCANLLEELRYKIKNYENDT